MSKIKRATRDQLCRRGNFWIEGMPLTEKDLELLQSLKKRADELGYTHWSEMFLMPEKSKVAFAAGRMQLRQQAYHLKENLSK